MPLKFECTTRWPLERFAPVWDSIHADLKRFVALMPHDETVEHLIWEIRHGIKQLLIVQDDERPNEVVLTCLAEFQVKNANGEHLCVIAGLGGHRLKDCLHLLPDFEAWAVEQHGKDGKIEMEIIGRPGWHRVLAKHGYALKAQVLSKRLD